MEANIDFDVVKNALRCEAQMLKVPSGQKISRRKARKLANRYRGSSRGERYADYLAGRASEFFVSNNRLVKIPKLGEVKFVTIHAHGVTEN